MVPSHPDVLVIRNNTQVNMGTFSLGAGGANPRRPVTAQVVVAFPGSADSTTHLLRLGETFPIGAENWYFAGAHFENAGRWRVTVRRLAPGEAPPVVDEATAVTGWRPAQRLPFGQLDEGRLQALEQALERPLPWAYRDWLSQTNGMQPVEPQWVPGAPFTLFPGRPLLGVHPEYPAFDLLTAEREWRVGKLSTDFVVIAVPMEGLLLLRLTEPRPGSVGFLPKDLLAGPGTPDAIAWRERQVVTTSMGWSFGDFLGRLTPLDAPGVA
ncbi:DUF6406 domain-containing protein [Micromonospora sp. LOL_021]|uniref:DUF6406 domain-containing protein n=1 Tax=Micromonospora sp. LOL_021 TaxID=3345417 RepID=UPI003A850851